ncbi:MAG TPA: uroporphyrinogen decarboxylase family protein [Clostridia bacterium]
MDSPKQTALKAFKREKTEYVPVGVFLGGSWPIINSGLTLEGLIGDYEKTARTLYEVNEKLNEDILIVGTGSTALLIKALGGDVRFDSKGAPQIISELIKNEEDLNNLNPDEAISNKSIKWLVDISKKLVEITYDRRLILASGRAPFTLAAQIYGLQNFLKAIYKNPVFAHELLEFTTKLSLSYFKTMINDGLSHGAFIADPSASGDVISKKHYEKFALPYLKKVVDGIKELDKPVMLHICGDITDRLDLVASSGIDSLSIDTKVDLGKALEIAGDKISIAGNVDPVDILEFGTQEEVYEATVSCLKKGACKRGFILFPGCDPAGGVPLKNIKTFVDTAHSWIF